MRFLTIWSIPAMTLAERLRRTRDWAAIVIGRALPLRVRYWVAMIAIGQASATSPDVPATTLADIINNLECPKHVS